MTKTYKTRLDVLRDAQKILNKSLRDIMTKEDVADAQRRLGLQGFKRKGYLGNLVEKYVFGQEMNSRSEADFHQAGVELKTTPLKLHKTKGYVAKERLVFSMIDYMEIVNEKWSKSSFLAKNNFVLLIFYIYEAVKSILDYNFKYLYQLDFNKGFSNEDIAQIKKDWEYIVAKVRAGQAHLLSEGETFYLGACTKAANSSIVRAQPFSKIPAKPRAFSLKQSYLNYIIHDKLTQNIDQESQSISSRGKAIEETVKEKLAPFAGLTDKEIIKKLRIIISSKSKQYKRLLANNLLGAPSGKIKEFEKSNVTLKVITLESDGRLKESLSFPSFDYLKVVTQKWAESDLHNLLEQKRFLFIIFRKNINGQTIYLQGFKFWNFPIKDLPEVEKIWVKTIRAIKKGDYLSLPKISDSTVAHVRPHGRDAEDLIETPQGTMEMRRSFWLNASYIEKFLLN